MTFHKTEQTVEITYTVEGPNEDGKFNVNDEGFYFRAVHDDDELSAIDKHLESLPKPPTSWDAYKALKEAMDSIEDLFSSPPLHAQTDLTEDDAIELMRLLGVLNA